jgi:5-formyltetrahydrofolate cyclo-ligase
MKKSDLRKKYIQKRETLSKDEVLILSEKIFENFLEKFALAEGQKVHCFLSINEKKEVDTQFFLDYFFKNNIQVFVPKIVEGKIISIEITSETSFIKSFYGITEPESNLDSREKDFDFVITPLLYCDNFGNRVGYGKGFYDQFFSEINSCDAKIGVSFFEPEEKLEEISDVDIPLDYLITPTSILSFAGLGSNSTK